MRRLSIAGFFCLLSLAGTAHAIPVEVDNPVADFLRRLEEKGIIAPGFWSTLPRQESEVAAVLNAAKLREAELGAWDRRRLDRYLKEFDPALRRQGTPLHYEDSAFTVIGGAEYFTGGYASDSLPKRSGYAFGSFTPRVEGTYGQHVYLTAAATVGMERNRDKRFAGQYDPALGLPYNTARTVPASVSTFDGFRTILGYEDAHLNLEAGQDWNQWGPGHWQHTTLSSHPYFWVQDSLPPSAPGSQIGYKGDESPYGGYRRGYRYPGEGPPLPQIRLRVGGKHWEYTKIIAQRVGLSTDSSAYLVAHRLQLRFGGWSFGGAELLATGTKAPNWIAYIPGVPLKISEHEGGDYANSAISVDAEYTWAGHGRVYGEFFLDDYSGPPLSFWGNKFAYTVGGSWQDPLGLPSELHLEYAVVYPWVYGHRLYNTALQNYGALLGSSLPPNSRAVYASVDFPLPGDVEGNVEWDFRQHDSKSAGSSIFEDYPHTVADETRHFLAQDVETRNQLQFSAAWSWDRYVQLKAGAGGLWVDTWHGNPGETVVSPVAFGEIRLKY